jgi:hypothetical protein
MSHPALNETGAAVAGILDELEKLRDKLDSAIHAAHRYRDERDAANAEVLKLQKVHARDIVVKIEKYKAVGRMEMQERVFAAEAARDKAEYARDWNMQHALAAEARLAQAYGECAQKLIDVCLDDYGSEDEQLVDLRHSDIEMLVDTWRARAKEVLR